MKFTSFRIQIMEMASSARVSTVSSYVVRASSQWLLLSPDMRSILGIIFGHRERNYFSTGINYSE